jgi:GNAT superfamily N-acetyltransferase
MPRKDEKESWPFSLTDGREVTIRWLGVSDAAALAEYFEKLDPEAKVFFAPNAFDRATAEALCAAQNSTREYLVAEDHGKIVAYFVLAYDIGPQELDYMKYLTELPAVSVAPSVLSEYRSTGLAMAMMQRLFARARAMGRTHAMLMGGVHSTNHRGLKYYQKCGFTIIGEFGENPVHYNMVAVL